MDNITEKSYWEFIKSLSEEEIKTVTPIYGNKKDECAVTEMRIILTNETWFTNDEG